MTAKEMELRKKQEVEKGTGEGTRPGPVFVPAVDIFENTNKITILADMPGVESNSVDIDLTPIFAEPIEYNIFSGPGGPVP